MSIIRGPTAATTCEDLVPQRGGAFCGRGHAGSERGRGLRLGHAALRGPVRPGPNRRGLYGRVVQETVGDPAHGVGGTYQYLYTTSGLPSIPFPGDPADAIVFRCVLTDRNDNQTVYGLQRRADARGGWSHTEPREDRHPLDGTYPSYVTWTAYNSRNPALLQVLPAGNSIAFTYENGIISGFPTPYNPPRRAVAQPHGLSGQFGGDHARSSG